MKRPREETIDVTEANPPELPSDQGLRAVQGWLSGDDPFLAELEKVVSARINHLPRTLGKPSKNGKA
jgi:hypothetical protein